MQAMTRPTRPSLSGTSLWVKHPLHGYVVHTTKYRALMLAKSSDPYASVGGKDKDTGIVSTVGD